MKASVSQMLITSAALWSFSSVLVATGDEPLPKSAPEGAVQHVVPLRSTAGDMLGEMTVYRIGTDRVAECKRYRNGRTADLRLFRDGKLHGVWTQYHTNGKVFAERPYRNGLPDGTFRFWDEREKLLGESEIKKGTGLLREYEKICLTSHDAEIPLVDGRIHGIQRVWAQYDRCRGRGCEIELYEHGESSGWNVVRDEDGTLMSSAYFHQGRLHGVLREWNRDGSLIDGSPSYWVKDKPVSEQAYLRVEEKDPVLAVSLKSDGHDVK